MKDKKDKKTIEVECALCAKFKEVIDELPDIDTVFGTDEEEKQEAAKNAKNQGDV